ncbi:hypothetical protein BS47DRAFT_1488771 [Hydnum rufescens UP504]|uniref:Uncharacterized protein n=1 Tax=Hydnum rufescens UP504 TaxID=1448309 RepID=A0A9P6DQQ2_9AGAM|nr:hypothetical protein BS47DRAFT_1488771 [Hydnum rufescens UP504]
MISIIVLVGVLIARLLTLPTVQAQTSNVTCLPTFNWSNNSLGQSPCLQAAWLQAQCHDGDWRVDTIPPAFQYFGPTQNNSTENACICTTVVYNLMSACGACQNRTWISWTSWSFYCVDYRNITEGTYNVTIPHGTAIPAWAFDLPSNHNDTFDISAAQDIGGQWILPIFFNSLGLLRFDSDRLAPSDYPERTGSILSPTPTSTSDSLLTGSPSVTSSSSSPTQFGGRRGSTSNAAAITGGVVGGVVGLGLIGLARIFWLWTH